MDLDARIVERWKPDDERPEILDRFLRWEPRSDLEPLDLNVEKLFEEALGPVPRP